MRKEDKSELIHDALNFLDEDMIEEVDRLRGSELENDSEAVDIDENTEMVTNGEKKIPWRRWTALAASICLLLVGSWAWEQYVAPSAEDGLNQENQDIDNMLSAQESANENDVDEDNVDEDIYVTDERESAPETEDDFVGPEDVTMPTVLGDIYQLHDNYVRVFMLPHKVWENAENEQEALKQAVVIGTEHKAEMDNLVEDMCEANSGLTEELPASDPDMIYHLFFEKEDGQIIHCWLLEDGYLYYHNKSEICLILDRSTYATIFKILATYW